MGGACAPSGDATTIYYEVVVEVVFETVPKTFHIGRHCLVLSQPSMWGSQAWKFGPPMMQPNGGGSCLLSGTRVRVIIPRSLCIVWSPKLPAIECSFEELSKP